MCIFNTLNFIIKTASWYLRKFKNMMTHYTGLLQLTLSWQEHRCEAENLDLSIGSILHKLLTVARLFPWLFASLLQNEIVFWGQNEIIFMQVLCKCELLFLGAPFIFNHEIYMCVCVCLYVYIYIIFPSNSYLLHIAPVFLSLWVLITLLFLSFWANFSGIFFFLELWFYFSLSDLLFLSSSATISILPGPLHWLSSLVPNLSA